MELKYISYSITKTLKLGDGIPPIEEDEKIGEDTLTAFSCYIALEKEEKENDPTGDKINLNIIDFDRESGSSIFFYKMKTFDIIPILFQNGFDLKENNPVSLDGDTNDISDYTYYKLVVYFSSKMPAVSSVSMEAIYLFTRFKLAYVCARAITGKSYFYENSTYINRLFSVLEFINKWIGTSITFFSLMESKNEWKDKVFPETASLHFQIIKVGITSRTAFVVSEYIMDPIYTPAVRRQEVDIDDELSADFVFYFIPEAGDEVEDSEQFDITTLTNEEILLLLMDMSRVLLGGRTRSVYASPRFIDKCLNTINIKNLNSQEPTLTDPIKDVINKITWYIPSSPLSTLFRHNVSESEREIPLRFIPDLKECNRHDLISAYNGLNEHYSRIMLESFFNNYLYNCNKCRQDYE